MVVKTQAGSEKQSFCTRIILYYTLLKKHLTKADFCCIFASQIFYNEII